MHITSTILPQQYVENRLCKNCFPQIFFGIHEMYRKDVVWVILVPKSPF
uniref:Uncharacterized protein n=1 Tax=Anguilla anguilla TaxID=7936 RepID=A0A0E9RP02_ANGAN